MADACPSAETLLCATTGDLSSREGHDVAAHLRACAPCRATLEDMVGTFVMVAGHAARGVSAEERVTATAGFASVLHARKQADIHDRATSRLKEWLPAAAVIFVVLVGAMLARATVVVQADEVVRQALLRARPHALSVDAWLRIDVRPVIVNGRSRVRSLSTVRQASEPRPAGTAPAWRETLPDDVVAGLDEYALDWEDPFRVDTFQAWRAQLSDKRDAVTRRTNEIVVTTRPVDHALQEVELVLDRATYQAVRVTWTLAGIGRMEIARTGAPPRSAPFARTEMAAAGRSDATELLNAELDVRLVLRQAGLDAGGIHVSNTGRAVRVDGNTASRSALNALATRLRDVPSVEFSVRHRRPPPREASVTIAPTLVARLDQLFAAGTEERELFVPTLTDLTRRVDERVGLLRGLDDRYSETVVERLNLDAKKKLEHLLNLQFVALNADLAALDVRLAVLAGASAPSRAMPLSVAPSDWRRRIKAARGWSQTLDSSVRRLVILGQPSQSSAPRAMRELWNAINARNAQF